MPGPDQPRTMEDRRLVARDGRDFCVRRATADDCAGLAAVERAVVAAGDGVVKTLADVSRDEAEGRRERAIGDLTGPSGACFVAAWVDTAEIVGDSGVWRLRPSLVRHVACLSLQVHPAAQRLGVGRALFEQAIAWATAGPGRAEPAVRRLELYVRADNARARALYESMGFEVEGVKRAFIRLVDGRLVDDLVMARLLGARG